MFDKLIAEKKNRYDELSRLLSTAEVQADPQEMRKHAKALAELEPARLRSTAPIKLSRRKSSRPKR